TAARSGTDFAVNLLRQQPNIRVLFISGLPVEGWEENDAENLRHIPDGSCSVLCKPVSPQVLLDAVDALLYPAQQHKPSSISINDLEDSIDNPWLQTMMALLRATAIWLSSDRDDSGSWNFHLITTNLC